MRPKRSAARSTTRTCSTPRSSPVRRRSSIMRSRVTARDRVGTAARNDIATLFKQTLAEEKAADQNYTTMAEGAANCARQADHASFTTARDSRPNGARSLLDGTGSHPFSLGWRTRDKRPKEPVMARIVIRCQHTGHYVFTGFDSQSSPPVGAAASSVRIASPNTSGVRPKRASTIASINSVARSRWSGRRVSPLSDRGPASLRAKFPLPQSRQHHATVARAPDAGLGRVMFEGRHDE